MKRSIALYAGILALSPFLVSAASATVCYSTGPMQNAVPNKSEQVFVKVLNNSLEGDVVASVLAFKLNGAKIPIFAGSSTSGPQSSDFLVPSVADTFEFEIQVKLDGPASNKTLLGVFGLLGVVAGDIDGALNPAHRLVHTELANIPCNLFGPLPPP